MSKQLHKISSYYAIFDPIKDGGFNVSFPDFPGCVTFGKNYEQATKMAHEALQLWIEQLEADRKPIPRKSSMPLIQQIQIKSRSYETVKR